MSKSGKSENIFPGLFGAQWGYPSKKPESLKRKNAGATLQGLAAPCVGSTSEQGKGEKKGTSDWMSLLLGNSLALGTEVHLSSVRTIFASPACPSSVQSENSYLSSGGPGRNFLLSP